MGSVFRNVADQYDLMNDLMSAGVHRCWKQEFMNTLNPAEDTQLLDVAGGTGEIAREISCCIRDLMGPR